MNIVIIEDEIHTAWELRQMIESLWPEFKVLTVIDSVHAGLEWFSVHPAPDLIFSDIQLGDGLSFDIFKKVRIDCPVVFCTAYDEYAINAFQNNGIDYILKPITENSLQKSIAKIELLQKTADKHKNQDILARLMKIAEAQTKVYKHNFLVSFREKIIPLSVDEIAYFYYAYRNVQIYSLQSQIYLLSSSLDDLETVLDPRLFYRANRQFIVSRQAIKEVERYFDRKLQVSLCIPTEEPLIISKAKSQLFLKWLENDHVV